MLERSIDGSAGSPNANNLTFRRFNGLFLAVVVLELELTEGGAFFELLTTPLTLTCQLR